MKAVREIVRAEPIDYAPVFEGFGPDEIVTVSGILTAKRGGFKEMLNSLDRDLVKKFHREATRRGHASLLTTPTFYFWVEGSRLIDLFFTAFPFGSYLMFSSRRIEVTEENIIVPDAVAGTPYEKDYIRVCEKLLKVYKDLLKIGHDQARNILPLGFSSYGLFSFPMQTILTAIKECELNHEIPEEIQLISIFFKEILKEKTPFIFDASEKAHFTGYPFPNIFGRHEIMESPSIDVVHAGDIRRVIELVSERGWKEAAEHAQTEILVKCVSTLSIAAWNEIKRHRTARQLVEPIYAAAERYLRDPREEHFHIPPDAGKNYIEAFHEAMAFYERLVDEGVDRKHAIYIVPHALKIKFKLLLDGYHLLNPFGFLGVRCCTTTHYEVRNFAEEIIRALSDSFPELEPLLGPKCKTGMCPERNPCGKVNLYRK